MSISISSPALPAFPRTLAHLKAGWKAHEAEEEGDGSQSLTLPTFYDSLRYLHRSNLSIYNRLRSIPLDADFAQQVSSTHNNLPLIPNERCGSWYVPPTEGGKSVYFKSTDGHHGQWNFNLRRLNLHLLDIVGEHGGCVIVDSTRRGKMMPDALAKTIPTWCAVVNRVLFPDREKRGLFHHALLHPHSASEIGISEWEMERINERLDGHADAFRKLLTNDAQVQDLGKRVQKPMKVAWVVGHSVVPVGMNSSPGRIDGSGNYEQGGETAVKRAPDHHLLILCSVSRRILGTSEMGDGGGYIQGAGDDSEHWARGLTPPLFWKYKEELLEATEAKLPDLIDRLLLLEERKGISSTIAKACPIPVTRTPTTRSATLIKPTSNLYIGAWNPDAKSSGQLRPPDLDFDLVINCHRRSTSESGSETETQNSPNPESSSDLIQPEERSNKHIMLNLDCPRGKCGSRDLRRKLHVVKSRIESLLQAPLRNHYEKQQQPGKKEERQGKEGGGAVGGRGGESMETVDINPNANLDPSGPILITCDTGRDLCVGVALMILCQFYDSNGRLRRPSGGSESNDKTTVLPRRTSNTRCDYENVDSSRRNNSTALNNIDSANGDAPTGINPYNQVGGARRRGSRGEQQQQHEEAVVKVDKMLIRQRLAWITASNSTAVNPSRSTLQSVNAFLMQRPKSSESSTI